MNSDDGEENLDENFTVKAIQSGNNELGTKFRPFGATMDVCRGENSSKNQEQSDAVRDAETSAVTQCSIYTRKCRRQVHRQELIRHLRNHPGSTENAQGYREIEIARRNANAERMRKYRAKKLAERKHLEAFRQEKGNVMMTADEIEEYWAKVHAEIAEYQRKLHEGHCAKDSQEMDSLQCAADSFCLRVNNTRYCENRDAKETVEEVAALQSREEGTAQDDAYVACTQLDKIPDRSEKEYGEETSDSVGLTAKALRMRKYREKIAAEETEEQAAERRARERARHRKYRMRTTVEQSTEEGKQRKVRAAQRSRKYREKLAVVQTDAQNDERRVLKAMHMRKLRRERIRQETEEEKALRLSRNAERMRKYRQSRRNRKAVGKRIPGTRFTVTCGVCADLKLESEELREKCESYKRLVAEQIRVNANSFRLLKAAKEENDNLMEMSRLQRQHTENTVDDELKLCLDTTSCEELTVKVEPRDLLPNEWDFDRESEQDDESDAAEGRGMLTREGLGKTELAGRDGEDLQNIMVCKWILQSRGTRCGATFSTNNDLLTHVNSEHVDKSQSNRAACFWEGCNGHFGANNSDLDSYLGRHVDVKSYRCPYYSCGKVFEDLKEASEHSKTHPRCRMTCYFPGCLKVFGSKRNMDDHYRVVHMSAKRMDQETLVHGPKYQYATGNGPEDIICGP